ncbi:MAG: hypothetical protein Q8R07_00080, partial [Candidatus Uhrbacteria bacterium]|nr:hypothetical protein [Candidatus Uhrbacteria bacterium]
MHKENLQWLLLALVVVGLIGLGVIISNQDLRLSQVSKSLAMVASQASNSAPVPSPVSEIQATKKAPATLDELRQRLATKDWTELYDAQSSKGASALNILTDFRFKNNRLWIQKTTTLLQEGMVSDASNPHITLSGCGENLAASFFGKDS